MKYKTFRNLVTLGGVTLLLGTCGLSSCFFSGETPRKTERATIATSTPTATPVQSNTNARTADQAVVEFLNRQPNATGERIKDAFPRESFKVNIYRDGNSPTWTRLKIDLDRDEKDDEKWTLANGQPDKRQVSTRDDGNYDREYRWRGAQWVEKK